MVERTAQTLPFAWYSDPEQLRREQDRIFRGAWHYAGHAGELSRPGDFAARMAGHLPVVVVHGEDGILRAFLNVCRHRGSVVVEGTGNRRTLQCRYHAWTYGLDGSLRAAPRADREEWFDPSELGLVPAQVANLGPLMFVNADANAPPLAALL